MRKFYYLLAIFAFFFSFSCNKSDLIVTQDQNISISKNNEATWILDSNIDHSKQLKIRLKIFLGHTIDQCGGRCIKLFGQYGHIDCIGFGNICNHIIDCELSEDLDEFFSLKFEKIDISDSFDEFIFPNRSLFITNPQNNIDLWLNIPEQLIINDSLRLHLMIHDVWFSENAEL